MLLHLSCTASAAHTDILQSTSESGCLMPFKVTETDKNIRIHDRMSDQRSFAVFSVYYRNLYLICSSKSISNNDLAACSNGIKTIEVGTVQMLQRILSTSRIKSVAVCQEW